MSTFLRILEYPGVSWSILEHTGMAWNPLVLLTGCGHHQKTGWLQTQPVVIIIGIGLRACKSITKLAATNFVINDAMREMT